MAERIEGKVAQLVTDDELIINVGALDGVEVGDIFNVLDPSTLNVREPGTNRPLGSIERVKAKVIVTSVNDLMSLARVQGRNTGLSSISRVLSGDMSYARLTLKSAWPDGVTVSDPAVKVKRMLPKQD